MKVGKQYIGRHVEVTWRDPGDARVSVSPGDVVSIPKGRAALATWLERGVITDLTDGVLRIEHSRATPGLAELHQSLEYVFTYVPEELVETIVVYVPETGERAESGGA